MVIRKEEGEVAQAHVAADRAMELQEQKGRRAFWEAVAAKRRGSAYLQKEGRAGRKRTLGGGRGQTMVYIDAQRLQIFVYLSWLELSGTTASGSRGTPAKHEDHGTVRWSNTKKPLAPAYHWNGRSFIPATPSNTRANQSV